MYKDRCSKWWNRKSIKAIELRDKKQCPECHTEIQKDDKYCRECGAKQEEQISEVEEDIEQQKEGEFPKEEAVYQKENNLDNEILKNENMVSNIEKTTEVEIDSKLNGDES